MPRDRGARERVATGIYRDATGFAVVAMVAGRQRERRYPPGTSIAALRDAREDLRTTLRRLARKSQRLAVAPGTLEAEARRYLLAVKGMASYKSRRRQIELWVSVLGRRKLATLDHLAIAEQLQRWLTEPRSADDDRPYSPQYVRHLRAALAHLFETIAPDGDNPVRRVSRPAATELLPRSIPVLDFARILRHFHVGSANRARLAVMATTSLGQTELMRLRPGDIDFAAGTVVARARRKAKGAPPRTIPMTRHARLALRLFVRLGAFGPFHTSNLRRDFRLAAARAGYVLRDRPTDVDGLDWRPYDARHTFLTAIGIASRDDRAVQGIGGHADARMVQRYTMASVDPRVAAAVAALDKRSAPRK